MSYLDSFLKGDLDDKSFIRYLKCSSELQDEINNLIPFDAVNNPQHAIWKCFSYNALNKDSFNLLQHLNRICYYNGKIGDNLNLFGVLKRLYYFYHPNFPFTNKYHDEFDLYLDAVQDCFDGPEVEDIINHTIEQCILIKPKAKRKKEAKERIKTLFHVESNSLPRWIQGPEWPMGKQSPMKFERQEKKGELVKYFFVDVDTGEEKVIEQLY